MSKTTIKNNNPGVEGGCGHSAGSLRFSAAACAVCGIVFILFLLVLGIAKIITMLNGGN